MREGGKACPCCGFLPPQKPVAYQMREGDLGLLERNGKVKPTIYDRDARDRWYAMLLYIAQERGRNPGSAYYRYVEKFGEKPSWPRPAPIEPTPEVIAWDRHCRIKYAKAMAAKARGEAV
jgi:hypothetical protein